jgi:multidrug efflux pump subunit AcrB
MKLAAAILFFVGFIVLYGVMGAYDCDNISTAQCAAAGILTLIGIAICGAIVGIDDIKKEIERRKK